ncbi:MAG: sugar ABC transporter substrate-binding protein [Deltaproteobacteria bacterium]|nr:sugar ABC transporter substrate-binding protein [Deltaproteobacteria bacterium]
MKWMGRFGLVVLGLGIAVGFSSFVGAQEKVTLRFSDWHLTEDVWNKSLTEGLAIFEKRYPNVKVVMEPVSYKDKETKYTVESAAGKAPDIFHVHAFSLPMFFGKGYAMDLTPFIEKEGGSKFLESWYPLCIDLVKHKGKVHAMPGDYMTMVLIYNTELFKAAGLDPKKPPQTWDEFLTYNKKLTKAPEKWGFAVPGAKDPGFELRFSPFLWSFGGDYLSADYKKSALDSKEAKEAFKFFVELYTKHKVMPPGVTSMNPQDVRTQLAHRKIAWEIGSGWTAPIVNAINPELKAFDVLTAAPLPVKKKKVTTIWLSSWVMSPNTKHPSEAWELLKFITSKEIELKWFVDNRVTSSRKDVSGVAPEILKDKFASVIASQLPHGKVVPQIPQWPEIVDTFTTAVQEAMTEMKTSEKALADAHGRINTILARKK